MQDLTCLVPALTARGVEAAAAAAKAKGKVGILGKPFSIAIADAGRNPLYFERVDAAPISARIAQDKAIYAALSCRETGIWEQIVGERPVLAHLPGDDAGRGRLADTAGVNCLGGIGVAGASSEQDADRLRRVGGPWLSGGVNHGRLIVRGPSRPRAAIRGIAARPGACQSHPLRSGRG